MALFSFPACILITKFADKNHKIENYESDLHSQILPTCIFLTIYYRDKEIADTLLPYPKNYLSLRKC